jgi:hypothetical protein
VYDYVVHHLGCYIFNIDAIQCRKVVGLPAVTAAKAVRKPHTAKFQAKQLRAFKKKPAMLGQLKLAARLASSDLTASLQLTEQQTVTWTHHVTQVLA